MLLHTSFMQVPLLRTLTSNLLDLGRRHWHRIFAFSLLNLVEYDSADIEIQAHADGVRRDQYVVAIVWLVEQLRLMPPHFWR